MLPLYTVWLRGSSRVNDLFRISSIHVLMLMSIIFLYPLINVRKGQALQFNWLLEKEAFILHSDDTFSVDFDKVKSSNFTSFMDLLQKNKANFVLFWRLKEQLRALVRKYSQYKQEVTKRPQVCFFRNIVQWQSR